MGDEKRQGRGGARPGAGAKRKPGPRDAAGRLIRDTSVPCACGGRRRPASAACRECYDIARRKPLIECVMCGATCVRRHSKSITCGVECGKARVRQVNAAKRTCAESTKLRRRRAAKKRRGLIGSHQSGRWRAVIERDGPECWICGGAIDTSLRAPNPRSPSVDHVAPISDGGADDLANLRAAHFGCNSRRGAALSRRAA